MALRVVGILHPCIKDDAAVRALPHLLVQVLREAILVHPFGQEGTHLVGPAHVGQQHHGEEAVGRLEAQRVAVRHAHDAEQLSDRFRFPVSGQAQPLSHGVLVAEDLPGKRGGDDHVVLSQLVRRQALHADAHVGEVVGVDVAQLHQVGRGPAFFVDELHLAVADIRGGGHPLHAQRPQFVLQAQHVVGRIALLVSARLVLGQVHLDAAVMAGPFVGLLHHVDKQPCIGEADDAHRQAQGGNQLVGPVFSHLPDGDFQVV